MSVIPQTKPLSEESLEDAAVVLIIPSDPVELSNMLRMVRERLLHTQTVVQVYEDTLFLNSLTRQQLAEEKVSPLAYAQRRLAVFELGILAMPRCPAFATEENRYVFEKLDRERDMWGDRDWSLVRETSEHTLLHRIFQPEDMK